MHPHIDSYFQHNGKDYLKVFLINSKVNAASEPWAVTTDSIQNNIKKTLGKPFIIMPFETKDGHTLTYDARFRNASEEKDHLLSASWPNSAGIFTEVYDKPDSDGNYWGIVQLTDSNVAHSYRDGYGPKWVSPQIIKNNPNEPETAISDWEIIHLAAVPRPAYGSIARVKAHCNGEQNECLLRLRNAGINSNKEDTGFCVKSFLRNAGFEHLKTDVTSLNSQTPQNKSNNSLSEENKDKDNNKKEEQPPTAAAKQETKQEVTKQEDNYEAIINALPDPVKQHIGSLRKEREELARRLETETFKTQQVSEKYNQVNDRLGSLEKEKTRKEVEAVLSVDAFDGDEKARKKAVDMAIEKGFKADDEFLKMMIPLKVASANHNRSRSAGLETKAPSFVPDNNNSQEIAAKIARFDKAIMNRTSIFADQDQEVKVY